MEYELIKDSLNDKYNPIKTILLNRGIYDWESYLKLNKTCVQDYSDLDNINIAVECFINHYNNRDTILIMPDEDCDGYTSSAMLYLYIKSLDKDYPIKYIMHKNSKSHGITKDIKIPDDVKLFIIADASTNDAEQCNEIINNGIDVIILDHHDDNYSEEVEEKLTYQNAYNNKSIIVNNQLSKNYINKDLSGAGIVYRFLQALDDALWENNADNFLDLCAIGNIADVMDIRSKETRYIIELGLKSINNNFLQSLFKAQEYSTKGIINIHNTSWYISPVINAVTRMGSLEERELLFKAMIGIYEEFEYKKRNGDIIIENIYDRAVRISKNVKSRQDKQRDNVFNEIKDLVDKNDKIVLLESEKAQPGLIGVSAMKLADNIKRPVIIVKKSDNSNILFGSCRNFDGSPIDDLKSLILKTKKFEFCSGHGNAAGLAIKCENVDSVKEEFNKLLKNVNFNNKIKCDFIFDINDFDIGFIQDIDKAKWICGTGIKEPQIAIKNIIINRDSIFVQGKNYDSIYFELNGIKFVQFKLKSNDPMFDIINDWDIGNEKIFKIDAVGNCNINEYEGIVTPQFIINDCNIEGVD